LSDAMVGESVNIVSEMAESFIEREAMANLCLVCFSFFFFQGSKSWKG